MLPNKEFRQMVPLLREKGFYEYETPQAISWPEYNQTEVENAIETLQFIRESVDEAELM